VYRLSSGLSDGLINYTTVQNSRFRQYSTVQYSTMLCCIG